MDVDVAACDLVGHLARRHRAIEAVLAGLQPASRAGHPQGEAEAVDVVHDAGIGETLTDGDGAGPLRDLDELLRRVVALERTVDAGVEPPAAAGTQDHQYQKDDCGALHDRVW